MKDKGSLWMTTNTFGVHQPTVSNVVVGVCSAISRHIQPDYIHLPRTQEEMKTKVAEFESEFGMIQAFRCVYGTHMPIRRPYVDS